MVLKIHDFLKSTDRNGFTLQKKTIDQSISINTSWKLKLVFTMGLISRENYKSRT